MLTLLSARSMNFAIERKICLVTASKKIAWSMTL
jgi:hypothetical protein